MRHTAPGDGCEDWVLPGGPPRPWETMSACARREVWEQTGLSVMPRRCAFVADVLAPGGSAGTVELIFSASTAGAGDEELRGEPGNEPRWVPVEDLRGVRLSPPVAGYLPSLLEGWSGTAAYLGNLWRDPSVAMGRSS